MTFMILAQHSNSSDGEVPVLGGRGALDRPFTTSPPGGGGGWRGVRGLETFGELIWQINFKRDSGLRAFLYSFYPYSHSRGERMPGPSQKMLPAKLLAKHYSKRPGRGG